LPGGDSPVSPIPAQAVAAPDDENIRQKRTSKGASYSKEADEQSREAMKAFLARVFSK
jgi:hypothetical protein